MSFNIFFFEIKCFKVSRIHAMEYYLALKSKGILTSYNIDESRSEVSESQKEKYCVVPLM